MKKLLTSVLMMSAIATANADNYSYLVFEQTDGNLSSLSASNLKITFSNGTMTATADGKTLSLSLSALSAMRFSNTDASGIETVKTDEISGTEVYNLSGMLVAQGVEETSLSGSLPSGVYIVKNNGETYKIRVK